MRIKQANRVPYQSLFLLMVFVFIMLDTKFNLPFGTILRWVMPAMLLLAVIITNNGRIHLANSLLYWLLIGVFAVAVFISPQLMYSVQRWLSFLLVTLTFISYFFFLKKQNVLYDGAAVFGWLYVAYGVLNFLFLQWGSERANGITGNPNSLGHFSNISFLFALLYYKKAESKKERRWMLIVMAASAICTVLAASRSATIILLGNVLMAAWLIDEKRLKVMLTIAVPVVILMLLFGVSILEKLPGISRLLAKEGIGADREIMWNYGVELIKQKPWFGWGYGISASLNITNYAFHNSYISIGIESGVIGVVTLILFLLTVFIKGMVSYWRRRRVETLIFLALAGNKVIGFIGESSMTSVGSAEGCFFWGVMMWLLVEASREKAPAEKQENIAVQ